MLKCRGGLCLDLEPAKLPGIEQRCRWQHLDRHAAAQRDLRGLIDDADSAPADLAPELEITQKVRWSPGPCRAVLGHLFIRELRQQPDRGQKPLQCFGTAGVVRVETPDVRSFSPSDLVGQLGNLVGKLLIALNRVGPRFGVHGEVEGSTPRSSSRTRSRSTARRCRILAALKPISRPAAISSKVS
jgi:hypothetical protein